MLRSTPSWRKFQLWNDLNMAMRQVALARLEWFRAGGEVSENQ
jgi:hypothetical protein